MKKPAWFADVDDPKYWYIDGHTIKGTLLDVWNGLDWTFSSCDPGPSIAGNLGPYWHVPFYENGKYEATHRLYPKLPGRWARPLYQALIECRAAAAGGKRRRRAGK